VIAKTLLRLRRRVAAGAQNALELARLGRLGEPYGAPYAVVDQGDHHKLRRYEAVSDEHGPVLLLVPPLMVTAEVYDVAPDVSAVAALSSRGMRVFTVDFGAPEREEGGMRRTLDDHVRAVVRCIRRVTGLTGKKVHLCGYSQGGMFAYQAAAYLRGEGIASIITFGSPVDVHRNLPALRSDVAGGILRAVEPWVTRAIDGIEGLPGFLTSTAFKMLSPRKELEQRIDFVRSLHDRNALVRREARRRFLNGEGFVAWPGPALRVFVEEFIVQNRLRSGGFVIDGRTVTLADVRCPMLAFIGTNDEIARGATIRPLAQAAPYAEVDFVNVPAGHFGLVVGSRAMKLTWPTVAEFVEWREGKGPRPAALRRTSAPAPRAEGDELEDAEFDVDLELFVDTLQKTMRSAWERLGDMTAAAQSAADAVRWQEPRLRRLAHMRGDTRIGPGLALAEAARRDRNATFFLWRERAFTYGEADGRVSNVVRGLWHVGVRPGDRVGVVMGSRPSFLTMVTALSRLGAVAVIAPPDVAPEELEAAFDRAGVRRVASDPEHGTRVHEAVRREVLVLGGGGGKRALSAGLVDMEAIDPEAVELPRDFEENAGRARDLAMILLRPDERGELRAAPVTNHRWALSALGAAAACTLKPSDTVYCCIPLHHPTGILVSVGAAVIGGTRLALGERFAPETFLAELRRYGATVVFYAGEMLRPLLAEPPSRGDRTLPVRLFAGSGMRPALAERLKDRFGVPVMEFYGGTTQRVILANASGEKPAALGRMLPGSATVTVVRCDLIARRPARDARGFLLHAGTGEPGLLAARLDEDDELETQGVVHGAFEPGDRWFVSQDVVRKDEGGDYWFVDSLSGFVIVDGRPVSTRAVEDALYALPEVRLAAAWDAGEAGSPRLVAAVVADESLTSARVAEALEKLEPWQRPERVVSVLSIPLTDGFRPAKRSLPSPDDAPCLFRRQGAYGEATPT
jgi:putative long chain acyl-CoA synthase